MMRLATGWRVTILTFLLSLSMGCFQFASNNLEEEKDPNFIEGKKRVNSLDYDGAIEYFEKALQANPRSAAAHFELGVLYEQKGNDYGAAIYHFQKHLQLRPNSPMAEVVKQHVTACKLELAKTVSFAVVNREVQRDLTRLNATNSLLKQQLQVTVEELNKRPQYVTNFVTNTVVTTQYVAQAGSDDVAELREPIRATPTRETQRRETQRPEPRRAVQNERSTSTRQQQRQQQRPQQNRRETAQTPTNTRETRAVQRPTPTRQSPTASRQVTFSYTVKRGETLSSISRKFGIPISKLNAVNPGLSAASVKEGRVIAIPAD